jgi:hypothetical protein
MSDNMGSRLMAWQSSASDICLGDGDEAFSTPTNAPAIGVQRRASVTFAVQEEA